MFVQKDLNASNILSAVEVNIKLIAKLIVDEIKEEDDYTTTVPNLSSCHQGLRNAYFECSQSQNIKHEYKDSNRKRTECYNCNEKLSINVNILAAKARVTLQHNLMHKKPDDVLTPPEIKQEI
ncbi:3534_t:CDS:2 [Cetraspora pellucida]|uniref:3534_t:CDS:1 n=1 Tax=Cetraspora pellucida TaxID=1433469 RepID=A0ACA9KTK1_9GLOM|nr:3534_t:CDS:2 [Cetraspora pellucida]